MYAVILNVNSQAGSYFDYQRRKLTPFLSCILTHRMGSGVCTLTDYILTGGL